MEKRRYVWIVGADYIVAENFEDAIYEWMDRTGEDPDDYDLYDGDDVFQVDDDEEFTIIYELPLEDDASIPPNAVRTERGKWQAEFTATIGEWIAAFDGTGWLAGEY